MRLLHCATKKDSLRNGDSYDDIIRTVRCICSGYHINIKTI